MKNYFLVLLGIFFFTSCSNDAESVDFNEQVNIDSQDYSLKNGNVDPVLKSLYLGMINSQSYKNYEIARYAFYDKVGDNIPESEISSGTAMLRWISNNITLTGFQTYADVVNEYNNVLALSSLSLQANNDFFEYMAGTPPRSLVPILIEVEPVPMSCKACTTAYNNCMGSARIAYADAIEAAQDSFLSPGGSWEQWNSAVDSAISTYQRRTHNCRYNLDKCCGGGSY